MRRRAFTQDEIEYLRTNSAFTSPKYLGLHLERDPLVVSRKCKALGLEVSPDDPSSNKYTEEEIDFIVANHSKMSDVELSDELHRPIHSIRSKIVQLRKQKRIDYKYQYWKKRHETSQRERTTN